MAKGTDPPELRREMGNRLRKLRKWTGLVQKDFATSVEIDPQTFSKLERGEQVFSIPTVRKIAQVYGVSADWLMAARDREPSFEANTDLRTKTEEAVDHYIRSMPEERSLHPETADKLRSVRFEALLGTVPSWDDIHDVRKILSRYERPRAAGRD